MEISSNITIMKTNFTKSRSMTYESPSLEIVDVLNEAVLCASRTFDGDDGATTGNNGISDYDYSDRDIW